MDFETTYKFTPSVPYPDITPSTSVRDVLRLGLEFTQDNRVDALAQLRADFAKVMVPLCTSTGNIKELQIPRRHDQSQIKDLAPLLSPAQGTKFCNEFFELMIPSLNRTAASIVQVKNGGRMEDGVKVGWFSKLLLKTLYRSIDTNDLAAQMSSQSDVVWKDDDKNEVEKHVRIGF